MIVPVACMQGVHTADTPLAFSHVFIQTSFQMAMKVEIHGDSEGRSMDYRRGSCYSRDELMHYQIYAKEFYETGHVKSAAKEKEACGRVMMSLLVVMLILCASLATGLTPLVLLSTTLHNQVDDLATKMADKVATFLENRLSRMTEPGPRMCDNVHNAYQVVAGPLPVFEAVWVPHVWQSCPLKIPTAEVRVL